ncbi:MAG: hypothetical protein KFF73_17830 [Cyclobacteriaceae bacterium]|nr:hypothetical protein [Cyclobacteriaceae bacterium]
MHVSYQTYSYYLNKILCASLFLLAEKAIYRKEEITIILADLHLGKAAHFRKAGIQIPETEHVNDYIRLRNLVLTYHPEKILIPGNLFHSDLNLEWNRFNDWVQDFKEINFLLIKENHDIFPENFYSLAKEVHENQLNTGPFTFVHVITLFLFHKNPWNPSDIWKFYGICKN